MSDKEHKCSICKRKFVCIQNDDAQSTEEMWLFQNAVRVPTQQERIHAPRTLVTVTETMNAGLPFFYRRFLSLFLHGYIFFFFSESLKAREDVVSTNSFRLSFAFFLGSLFVFRPFSQMSVQYGGLLTHFSCYSITMRAPRGPDGQLLPVLESTPVE